jgi:ABC-2 type transport system ATP-binding protein
LARRDGGEVSVLGADPAHEPVRVFRQLGYAPELPNLPSFFTAREFLEFVGRLHDLSSSARQQRAHELLELVGLLDHAEKKIAKYSKGMVQRLALAQALVHDPELLVLDEPTLGMDPAATVYFRDVFRALRNRRKAVLLSSHLLDEVQRLCTHVAMIQRGRISFAGPVEEVLRRLQREALVAELRELQPPMVEAVRALPFVAEVEVTANTLRLTINDGGDHRAEVSQTLVRAGGVLLRFVREGATLEDAYLQALRGASV